MIRADQGFGGAMTGFGGGSKPPQNTGGLPTRQVSYNATSGTRAPLDQQAIIQALMGGGGRMGLARGAMFEKLGQSSAADQDAPTDYSFNQQGLPGMGGTWNVPTPMPAGGGGGGVTPGANPWFDNVEKGAAWINDAVISGPPTAPAPVRADPMPQQAPMMAQQPPQLPPPSLIQAGHGEYKDWMSPEDQLRLQYPGLFTPQQSLNHSATEG